MNNILQNSSENKANTQRSNPEDDAKSGNGNGNGGNNGNNGSGGNNGNGNVGGKKVELTVIVSGTATTVEANENQKLKVVAQKALEQTGNTARPLEDWTLKTRDGEPLELDKTVEEYGLLDGSQLVMSLEAGVGG